MIRTSRRHFLQAAAASSAVGMLGTRIAAAQGLLTGPIMDRARRISASHWGILEAETVGGRLSSVAPFATDPGAASPVMQALADQVYAETRVRYPMVREGFLKNGHKSDTTERGRGKFVRVGWDKALDLVASELERVKKAHGNAAIHAGSTDWHSVGKLHNSSVLLRRMLGLHGGYTDNSGDFSIAAAMVILPHILGGLEVYEQQSAWPTVINHSDLVVLWGCDILKNNQIGWSPTDHSTYEYIKALKAKGTKVISIDPRVTDTAEYLGAEQVAVRPNTDTALMLAIAHTLVTENLYDKDFVERYTVGFDKFAPYLLGKEDGVAKTPGWAAAITDIPADRIVALARAMAKGRTMLMGGWAIQRAHHGEQPYWMLITLAAMLGQIGLPGGGFGLSYHYANGGSLTADGAPLGGISAGDNAVTEAIPYAHGLSDMLLNPGTTVAYNGESVTYPDIRLIYWAGGNPFSHQMDRNRHIEAWQRPETIIVNEPFWSATARFADIVLPVTTPFERNDIEIVSEYSGRWIVAMPKLIEPLFEARSDYDIFAAISKRLGFADKFTEGNSEMAWIASFYDAATTQAAMNGIDMPDFDSFWAAGTFEFSVPDSARDYVRFSDFRADPAANALGTPSGRIEIFSETIAGFGYDDCPGHPTWLEPAEWLGAADAKTYPLHILSPHPKFRLHSQMDNTWLRETYEVAGREPVWINPADAAARKIADGDIVRIHNARGQLLAGAIVTDRVRAGVVILHEGAWYDPDEPGKIGALCKNGNINVLTSDRSTSRLAQGNTANTALVEVERYTGPVAQVTAFEPVIA
ncbi:MAG: trimethylamine-N-oxide reductase TorA [Rhodobacteraceae bacterium]|nr:trimethylamine-N-oxide reductase TorA [Paracoccaceae bacterium]MCP5340818.1 trimethylamine-N-oxide reductase TorA [Paracoccaceae bacterium]